MGEGVVDPLLCELYALPCTAPNNSGPLLLHRDTERKGTTRITNWVF